MENAPSDEQWDRIHALSSRLDALEDSDVARELADLERKGGEEALVMSFLRTNYELESRASPPGEGDVLAGRYSVVSKLGEGGMGTVYRAHHDLTQRDVAVKLVHPTLVESPAARERFLSEISLQAKLSHPGIVRVFDADIHEPEDGKGKPHVFLAMELIEGRTLPDYLKEEQPGVTTILQTFERFAMAIAHAHSAGILHLDIKPQNIIVRDADSSPVVLDFGLAAAIASTGDSPREASGGTLAYMTPEALKDPGRGGSVATDIYASGVVLYELLAGKHPFLQEGTENLRGRISEGSRPPLREVAPALPKTITAIVERAMAVRPEDRFATMAELAAALTKARAAIENAAAYRRGIVRAALVSSIIGAVLVGLAVTAWTNARRARAAAADAALGEARALAVSSQGAAVSRGLEVIGSLQSGAVTDRKSAEFRDAAVALLARDDVGTPVLGNALPPDPTLLTDVRPGTLSWGNAEFTHSGFPFVRRAGFAATDATRTYLATTSPESHHVFIWEIATRRLIAFAYHPAIPVSVDWGGSDDRFAVGTRDGRVAMWAIPRIFPVNRDPVRIKEPLDMVDGPAGGLRTAAFHSATGALGMLGDAGITIEFEPGNGGRRQQLQLPAPCTHLAFSPEGAQLTASGPNGTWHLPVHRSPILQKLPIGAARGVGLAISTAAGRLALVDGNSLRLFSLAPLVELGSRKLGLGRILENSGTRIAIDSRDTAIAVDIAQPDPNLPEIQEISVPTEGSRIFSLADPTRWATFKGRELHFPDGTLQLPSETTSARFLPGTGSIIATTAEGIHITSPANPPTLLHHFPRATAYAIGAEYIFTGTPGKITRHTLRDFSRVSEIPIPGDLAPEFITYIPQRGLLAIPDGRSLLLLHADDGTHAVRLPLQAGAATATAGASGNHLAVVAKNGILSLWDLAALAEELTALGLPISSPPPHDLPTPAPRDT